MDQKAGNKLVGFWEVSIKAISPTSKRAILTYLLVTKRTSELTLAAGSAKQCQIFTGPFPASQNPDALVRRLGPMNDFTVSNGGKLPDSAAVIARPC